MTEIGISSSPSHKLVVSIINYRTAEMTIRCIRSVLDDMQGIDAHVAVVDNLSGDGSAEQIEAFWCRPVHRQARAWREHPGINSVMLATSLAPDGYHRIEKPLRDELSGTPGPSGS